MQLRTCATQHGYASEHVERILESGLPEQNWEGLTDALPDQIKGNVSEPVAVRLLEAAEA